MNRMVKNIIVVVIIAILGTSMFFTMRYAKKDSSNEVRQPNQNERMGNPPNMNGDKW